MMEVHRFEKAWAVVSVVLIVAFIGTVTYGTLGAGVEMVDDSGGTVDAGDLENTEFAEPGVRQVGEDEYEAYVVARQFLFQPGTSEPIRVPADSTVTFYVTSADVVHGFQLVGTNVNTMVIPGQVAEVTVEFDEPRTYGVVCHEYCGAAHHDMAGQVVVVPPEEYEGPGGGSG
jgi:cytochrome c oxidase subunit 2